MSDKTIDSLLTRMKVDKAFRSRMLNAGKDGFAAALRQEGYGFTPDELKDRLPAVKSGLRVGLLGRLVGSPFGNRTRDFMCDFPIPRP
jgi:hypothetical protein